MEPHYHLLPQPSLAVIQFHCAGSVTVGIVWIHSLSCVFLLFQWFERCRNVYFLFTTWSVINTRVCHRALENRCMRSTEIRNKYPDRVPVSSASTSCPRVVDDVMVVISAVCGWSGHFGEGPSLKHCGRWQEGVFVAHWLDGGPVHVYNQETHQPAVRGTHVPVCGPGVAHN